LRRARDLAEPAHRAISRDRPGDYAVFRDGLGMPRRGGEMSRDLPRSVAILVLGPSGAALGRKVRDLLPAARLHGLRRHPGEWDESYDRLVPHIAALFAAGTPIIGLCASGILIRAIGPLLDDKHAEPPVVALAEDGSVAVPLLG